MAASNASLTNAAEEIKALSEALAKAREELEKSEAECIRLRKQSVEGLTPKQVKTLLGDDFAATQQEQILALRAQLTAATQAQRAAEQQL